MLRLSASEQQALMGLANELADAASEHTMPLFRSGDLATDNKDAGGFDPVTQADRAAEKAMRTILARARPDDGIFGEEFDNFSGTTGLTWVLDPIDGTRAFISGVPTWGTLIGLDNGQGPVLGIIEQPYIGERFAGAFGAASLQRHGHSRPISVRTCSDLSKATLFTTYPEIGTPAESDAFRRVSAQAHLVRYGLDCYAYGLLAMGQIDLIIEAGLQPYDIQGPQGVIEAAGGIVTDWEGGPPHRGGRVIAAGDRRVYQQALDLLKQQ